MPEDHFGFLAYVMPNDAADMFSALDQGLQEAGFAVQESSLGPTFRRTYMAPSGWPVRCSGAVGEDSRPGWPQGLGAWAFFPIDHVDLTTESVEHLLTAVRAGCVATRAVLGRTFHPAGIGGIEPAELDGAVDYLDWLQYFGPGVSQVIGAARIQSAGFWSVEFLPNGAHLARTRRSYLDEWPIAERRPLIERLGIHPRTLLTKGFAGNMQRINWC